MDPPGLALGPGYSHVVVADAPGRLVAVSGQIALDAGGQLVGVGDLAAQTRQVLANLHAALAAAGADWDHVVKIGYYLTDVTQVAVMRAARDEIVPAAFAPASTLVEVSRLVRPDLLVEIDALAVIPA
ncbi:RidA family protein [Actinomadura barringtoniae]|uniref:RidA family protein n=1 Tax=Actinomadura barringtoniae TaxID=1427535 RepID=A0A939PR36_9ACTN|nr:RidA family protein [Actinomadura barringtoniae]